MLTSFSVRPHPCFTDADHTHRKWLWPASHLSTRPAVTATETATGAAWPWQARAATSESSRSTLGHRRTWASPGAAWHCQHRWSTCGWCPIPTESGRRRTVGAPGFHATWKSQAWWRGRTVFDLCCRNSLVPKMLALLGTPWCWRGLKKGSHHQTSRPNPNFE